MGFAVRHRTLMGSGLAFTFFSKYGTAAPLLLFSIPTVIVTTSKQIVGVQLFVWKSKLKAPRSLHHRIGGTLQVSGTTVMDSTSSVFRKGQNVPT